MQATFFQKVLLTMICSFFAACLFYVYVHIVQEAFYESNDGWKTSLYQTTPSTAHDSKAMIGA